MILRIARSLRAHAFFLVALLGVALLLLGVFEYWRFYRDLYVEEVETLAALEQAAGSDGNVYFLRTGTPADEWRRLERESPPGLMAMPFVGRVGQIQVNLGDVLDPVAWEAVRERALRLPGLGGFDEDRHAGGLPAPSRTLDLRRALGRPLPEFDAPIAEAELEEPFQRGEPLEADAAQKVFDATLESWTASESAPAEGSQSFDRPYLAVLDLRQALVAELRDGDRLWHFASDRDELAEVRAAPLEEWVALSENGVRQELDASGDEWRLTARKPNEERFGETDIGWSPSMTGFQDLPYMTGSTPLRSALKLLRAEQIDDARYVIEFAPCKVQAYETIRFRTVQVVVRSDLEFALERARLEFRSEGDERLPNRWQAFDEVRRLRRGGGAVFWTERLTRQRFRCETEYEPRLERERFAVEFEPQNYASAFDLGTYGVRPWREPEPLPELRSYRLLLPAGLVAVVFGVVGQVAQSRRPKRRSNDGFSTTAGRREALPALRFGFLTLGSAALLTISLAGWYKSKLDELEQESSLLARLDGGAGRTERHEPGFPWSALASATFPIDSPLKSANIWTSDTELRDAFLRLPRLERFQASAVASHLHLNTLRNLSLGTPVPVPSATIGDAEFAKQLPPGQTLSADEARDVASRMFAAWGKTNRPWPQRLCVASSERFPSWESGEGLRLRIELRDGERFWKALAWNSPAADPFSQSSLWCSDGTRDFLYARREPDPAFPKDQGAWTLASRRYVDDDEFVMFDVDAENLKTSTLPRPFAWVGCDPVGDRMADWLETHSSSLAILDVERLPDEQYRVELEPPHVPPAIAQSPFPWEMFPRPGGVARWTIVVDERTDWSVERSEMELVGAGHSEREPIYRATSLTVSRYERIGGRTAIVACRTRVRAGPPESDGRTHERSSAWAYDFSPAIDERIFRMPSLDYPHSPPDPVPEPVFAWWMATAIVACGGFVYAAVGRIREARRGRRERRGDSDGNDAQEGTVGDESSSAVATSTASEVAS